MALQNPSPIAYPTLAEFLQERVQRGHRPRDDAALLDVEEQTVIGWASGNPPNPRYWSRIEKKLGYSFVERRFAEAAKQTGFPPAEAIPEISVLDTYAKLHGYLTRLASEISQVNLADFLGWPATNLSAVLCSQQHLPELNALILMLQKIPALPPHLTGEVISKWTPRIVLGCLLRNCRQKRGQSPAKFAQRVGITHMTLRVLEDLGRNKISPSRQRRRPDKRAGYFKDEQALQKIIGFLQKECRELNIKPTAGKRLDVEAAGVAPPDMPSAKQEEAPARPARIAPTPAAISSSEIIGKLRQFAAQCSSIRQAAKRLGLPHQTVCGVLKIGQARPSTMRRITQALDTSERQARAALASLHPSSPMARAAAPAAGPPDRLAALENRVNELEATLRTFQGSPAGGQPSDQTGEYVSPLSPQRFQQRDERIGEPGLSQAKSCLRRAAEVLGRLASLSSDGERWRVQTAVGREADELFVTLEGFFREYPSGALATIETQRRFLQKFRHRLNLPAEGETTDTTSASGD